MRDQNCAQVIRPSILPVRTELIGLEVENGQTRHIRKNSDDAADIEAVVALGSGQFEAETIVANIHRLQRKKGCEDIERQSVQYIVRNRQLLTGTTQSQATHI
jgi:hypothetical protein